MSESDVAGKKLCSASHGHEEPGNTTMRASLVTRLFLVLTIVKGRIGCVRCIPWHLPG